MTELIDIQNFKKKGKTRYLLNIILISCLLVVTITGAVLSLLFSTLDYIPNLVINIVICALVAVFTIFYFFNIFPIVKHYYAFYKGMSDINLEHRRRMVFYKEIGTKTMDNVKYRVLQFLYSEGENEYNENLYVLDSDSSFEENKAYKIVSYHNVIIRFEEINNANN